MANTLKKTLACLLVLTIPFSGTAWATNHAQSTASNVGVHHDDAHAAHHQTQDNNEGALDGAIDNKITPSSNDCCYAACAVMFMISTQFFLSPQKNNLHITAYIPKAISFFNTPPTKPPQI